MRRLHITNITRRVIQFSAVTFPPNCEHVVVVDAAIIVAVWNVGAMQN